MTLIDYMFILLLCFFVAVAVDNALVRRDLKAALLALQDAQKEKA